MKIITALLVAAACVPCLEWTRLTGTVKIVNLRDSTVTIQNRDGDLLTVPIDYQIKMVEKHGETRELKGLSLDEKITLIRVQAARPVEDNEGMAPPEPTQRGR
jgi:hypothetical protein